MNIQNFTCDFSKQTVLITGAGGGLGNVVADAFLQNGAQLVLVDLQTEQLEKKYGQHKNVLILQADVTKEEDVKAYTEKAIDKFGSIDVFFNNAGIEARNNLLEHQSLQDFQKVLDVNTIGVFLGLKYVIPYMKANNAGIIINTASSVGLVGSVGISPYVAAKHAVVGLTKSAALECASHNIRVNSIAPGFIETELTQRLILDTRGNQKATDREKLFLENIPLGRFAKAEEVSNLVLFLSSPFSSYITGTCVEIDGGRAAK